MGRSDRHGQYAWHSTPRTSEMQDARYWGRLTAWRNENGRIRRKGGLSIMMIMIMTLCTHDPCTLPSIESSRLLKMSRSRKMSVDSGGASGGEPE